MKSHYFARPVIRYTIRTVSVFVLLAISSMAFAQSVTILPNGITPSQGGVPRLSYEAIMAIPSPQKGDMAYDLTFNTLRLYKKKQWVKVLTGADITNPSMIAWQVRDYFASSVNAVATDTAGNVYIAGFFNGPAYFENTVMSAAEGSAWSLFIAKYNSTGNLIWVQRAGHSPGVIQINEMVLDAAGNIYVAGFFNQNATFDATTLTNAGMTDIFLAKYNSTGNFQWVRKAGGPGEDEANDLTVADNGDIYICGSYKNNAVFGLTTLPSAGGQDMFVASYNNDGFFQWVQKGGGSGSDIARSIVVNSDGDVTVAGNFQGSATFSTKSLTSAGGYDIFMLRYSSAGALAWAKGMGGTGNDYGNDLCTNTAKELYIVGEFEGTANIANESLTSKGGSDIYVARFSNLGNSQWAFRDGGVNNDFVKSVFLGNMGSIYIAGSFVESTLIGDTELTGKGDQDILVAKYEYIYEKKFKWAQSMGNTELDRALKLTADSKMNVYSVGTFLKEVVFGEDVLSTNFSNNGFVVRLRD